MNRIQIACYGLMASAFVLAGLLVSALPRLENQAQAQLVVNRDNITLMTARSRLNEQALFVIENNSQRLLIYTLDIGRRRLNLAQGLDLATAFASGAAPGAPATPTRGAR